MEKVCSFCSNSSEQTNVASLINLDFIDDGVAIKFSTILSDVLPSSLLNLDWICESCYIVIVKFFQLKKQVLADSQQLISINKEEVEPDTSCTVDEKAPTEYVAADKKFEFDLEATNNNAEDSKVSTTVDDDASELLVEVLDKAENNNEPTSPDQKRRSRSRNVPVIKLKREKPKRVIKYIKGRTPKLLKPSKTSQVFDLLYDDKLTLKQLQFVNEQLSASKIKHDLFHCSMCSKTIHSSRGFRYHLVSRHVLRSDPQKAWVAKNLEAGHRVSFIKGQKQEDWNCTVCSKEFKSHPAIRYHLNRHIIEGDLKIDL